jgi:phosphate transport system permease protein
MDETGIRAIRALIAKHKRWDLVFAVVGVMSLMLGILTFVTLFVDMIIDGVPASPRRQGYCPRGSAARSS